MSELRQANASWVSEKMNRVTTERAPTGIRPLVPVVPVDVAALTEVGRAAVTAMAPVVGVAVKASTPTGQTVERQRERRMNRGLHVEAVISGLEREGV